MLLLFYSVSEGGGICDMSSPRLSIPDNWWAVSFVFNPIDFCLYRQ